MVCHLVGQIEAMLTVVLHWIHTRLEFAMHTTAWFMCERESFSGLVDGPTTYATDLTITGKINCSVFYCFVLYVCNIVGFPRR